MASSFTWGETRIWRSASGQHEIRAELISADETSVELSTEDGRTITVPLDKLSQADRDYVAQQQSNHTPAAADVEEQIKQQVALFYRAVARKDESLRELLTPQGQTSYDRSPAFFQNIWAPDRGQRPRVTDVHLDAGGASAVADYQVRLRGKTFRMQMLFVSRDRQWRVKGIVGPGPNGTTNVMDFETAQTENRARDATLSTDRPPQSHAGTHADVPDRGAIAYVAGMCAKCHGPRGTGTPRGPDLTDDDWQHCDGTVAGIRQVLLDGIPKEQVVDASRPFGMNPATNLVPAAEIDVLAEYVASLAPGTN